MSTSTYDAVSGTPRAQGELGRVLELIRVSALRSLKVRYRGSALGILWSLTNPLLMTAVYSAIFGTAFSKFYDGSVVRYVLSAFVGLVVVTFFTSATSEALVSVVSNGALLNKIAIPPVVFPLSSIAANVFQQGLTTFPIAFVLSIAVARDPLRALLVPVVLLGLSMLASGFALALSAMYVFFRDLPYLWQIVAFILWLTSPMFYPIELAPPSVRPWFELNPVAQNISALREVVINRGPINLHYVAESFTVGLVVLALGALLFRATRRDFMDLV